MDGQIHQFSYYAITAHQQTKVSWNVHVWYMNRCEWKLTAHESNVITHKSQNLARKTNTPVQWKLSLKVDKLDPANITMYKENLNQFLVTSGKV